MPPSQTLQLNEVQDCATEGGGSSTARRRNRLVHPEVTGLRPRLPTGSADGARTQRKQPCEAVVCCAGVWAPPDPMAFLTGRRIGGKSPLLPSSTQENLRAQVS